jgi:hypothetical protein
MMHVLYNVLHGRLNIHTSSHWFSSAFIARPQDTYSSAMFIVICSIFEDRIHYSNFLNFRHLV